MAKEPMIEVRLDRWLWAARFYKTRSIAVQAVNGGHVEVNGSRAKPARGLRVGDHVCIRKAPYTYTLSVSGLSQRRGPASDARALYAETEDSTRERERLARELKSAASQVLYDPKKPGTRELRQARTRKREHRG